MTIADTTFAFLDTETTHKEPNDPLQEVLEVAVRLYTSMGTLFDSYSSLIAPKRAIPPESSGIHHLTIDDFRDAPSRLRVDSDLAKFVPADAIIVAHNADFDSCVIDSIDNNLGNARWLCSERLAHHVYPEAPDFKLQTLRYCFGLGKVNLEGLEPHRAEADVIVLAGVFFQLLARYRAQAPAGLLSEDVDELLKFARSPYTIERWPMGPAEAKGKLLGEVDHGLLKWALNKADLNRDMRWNIERELTRRRAA